MAESFPIAPGSAGNTGHRLLKKWSIVACSLATLMFLVLPVAATAPVAAFSATPLTGTVPLTVQFTDASTNTPTSWSWEFGNGFSSALQSPSYTYTTAGTYSVTLDATNADGNDSEVKTNYITVTAAAAVAPDADFTADVTSGIAPLTVQFTDESDNSPTSWSWTFGDGDTSNTQNPEHEYEDEGTYTVTLKATNSAGTDTKTRSSYITVAEAADPVASFTADVTSGDAPLTVEFEDTSKNYPTAWKWNFGDGETSTEENPEHEYEDEGTFTVTLKVTNDEGSDTLVKEDFIVVGDVPKAAFSATPTSGSAPLTVRFTDSSTNDPKDWYWTFGDGYSSVASNPTHEYSNTGTYTVTLKVSNDAGSNTMTKSSLITVSASKTTVQTTIPTTIRTTARTTRTTAPVVTETTAEPAPEENPLFSLPVIGGIALVVIAIAGVLLWNSGRRGRRWEL